MIEKTFLSSDGKTDIHYFEWLPEGEIKGILQIIHGMAEFTLRYEDFALWLCGRGIMVCGNDHIGHGRSTTPEDKGYFGEKDGWKYLAADAEKLRVIESSGHQAVPYYMLGHSMGSFVVRAWITQYYEGSGVEGVVVMGTAGTNPSLSAGLKLSNFLKKVRGGRARSGLLSSMAFKSNNKRIPDAKTPNDWLTRDEGIVAKYNADPMCGFGFTTAGFADLFSLIGFISTEEWYGSVPKDLPLLFVAGGEDPVGGYGAGPAEVVERLHEKGCGDVNLIIYEGMRHEILNEIGKETVMEDILSFILDEER